MNIFLFQTISIKINIDLVSIEIEERKDAIEDD
jgi:hypothetical protein